MMKTLFILLVSLIILPSCYTIHFTKEEIPNSYEHSQWHHIGLFGLMEFSKPINLKETCPEDSWDGVRVQQGFVQALAKALPMVGINGIRLATQEGGLSNARVFSSSLSDFTYFNVLAPSFIAQYGVFYSPEEVSVSCKK